MPRETTPLTTNQVVRAFRKLNAADSQRITAAAERLQAKTGLELTECLQVLASIGVYAIRHGN